MALTLVPPSAVTERPRRFGTWAKISISLMTCGALALGTASVIGVHWFYGLHRLVPSALTSSISVPVGQPYLIDELAAARGGSAVVDLRSISARVAANTAGASVVVETCAGASSVTSCDSPAPFRPGMVDLTATRIVVVVRGARPGTVRLDGVQVSYRDGVRAASQHIGPTVTLTVR